VFKGKVKRLARRFENNSSKSEEDEKEPEGKKEETTIMTVDKPAVEEMPEISLGKPAEIVVEEEKQPEAVKADETPKKPVVVGAVKVDETPKKPVVVESVKVDETPKEPIVVETSADEIESKPVVVAPSVEEIIETSGTVEKKDDDEDEKVASVDSSPSKSGSRYEMRHVRSFYNKFTEEELKI
jgi:hypothetical protein